MNTKGLIVVALAVTILALSMPTVAYAGPASSISPATYASEAPPNTYQPVASVVVANLPEVEHGPVYDVGEYDPRIQTTLQPEAARDTFYDVGKYSPGVKTTVLAAPVGIVVPELSQAELDYYRDIVEHMNRPESASAATGGTFVDGLTPAERKMFENVLENFDHSVYAMPALVVPEMSQAELNYHKETVEHFNQASTSMNTEAERLIESYDRIKAAAANARVTASNEANAYLERIDAAAATAPSAPAYDVNAYLERIDAAAATAPSAPAYDVNAYLERIDAAAGTAPTAPVWEQQSTGRSHPGTGSGF